MSVLIKDMKMPKSCNSCDLLQDYDGDMYCPLNSYLNFGDIENVPDYVMDSCPLSEVPERKKGEWIEHNPQNSDTCRLIECDQCGFSHIVGFNVPYEHWIENRNFCERCGADMRKGEGEKDGQDT